MADNEVANSGAKTSTPAPSAPVAPASFPSLDGEAPAAAPKNIDFILDGQGSVIELEKLAGEPMEVLVNNKLVARGEVVVVNEKFGIRLTDVISAAERVQQLA
jgi:flagellar motor switch protein FliN/FliY